MQLLPRWLPSEAPRAEEPRKRRPVALPLPVALELAVLPLGPPLPARLSPEGRQRGTTVRLLGGTSTAEAVVAEPLAARDRPPMEGSKLRKPPRPELRPGVMAVPGDTAIAGMAERARARTAADECVGGEGGSLCAGGGEAGVSGGRTACTANWSEPSAFPTERLSVERPVNDAGPMTPEPSAAGSERIGSDVHRVAMRGDWRTWLPPAEERAAMSKAASGSAGRRVEVLAV